MSSAPSLRQLRVCEMIKRSLQDMIIKGEIDNVDATMVSVSVVDISADLRSAKVYIIPHYEVNLKEILVFLKEQKGQIRHYIGKHIKLKYVPDLFFYQDKSLDNAMNVMSILKSPRVQNDVMKSDCANDE